jgi:hypothetical protein
MKNTEIIIMQGRGSGQGEKLYVLHREEIRKIIKNLDWQEIFEIAYENSNRREAGICSLELDTGKLVGYSLGDATSLHAMDSQEILLCKIPNDKNNFLDANIHDILDQHFEKLEQIESFDLNEIDKYEDEISYIQYLEEKYPRKYIEVIKEIEEINRYNYDARNDRALGSDFFQNDAEIEAQIKDIYDYNKYL